MKSVQYVTGIRVWNYNKSPEDTLRGARDVTIFFDDVKYFNLLLRPGPGYPGLKFDQTIIFDKYLSALELEAASLSAETKVDKSTMPVSSKSSSYISPPIKQDYETLYNPSGMLWKFNFVDNWGDGYYLGLDKVEFYDNHGNQIDVLKIGGVVSATPYSVQDISVADNTDDKLKYDPRIPEKLFYTENSSLNIMTKPMSLETDSADNDAECWLCPLSRCMTQSERMASIRRMSTDQGANMYNALPRDNVLFVEFPYPVRVSCIRIYNYTKTPSRGVRDFSIHCDGNVVYMGTLKSTDSSKNVACGYCGQSVLFTNDVKVVKKLKDTVNYCGSTEQDLLCINERQVMVKSKYMYNDATNVALEGIHSDLSKRPKTAVVSHG